MIWQYKYILLHKEEQYEKGDVYEASTSCWGKFAASILVILLNSNT